jgi:hypothetical protein
VQASFYSLLPWLSLWVQPLEMEARADRQVSGNAPFENKALVIISRPSCHPFIFSVV